MTLQEYARILLDEEIHRDDIVRRMMVRNADQRIELTKAELSGDDLRRAKDMLDMHMIALEDFFGELQAVINESVLDNHGRS